MHDLIVFEGRWVMHDLRELELASSYWQVLLAGLVAI